MNVERAWLVVLVGVGLIALGVGVTLLAPVGCQPGGGTTPTTGSFLTPVVVPAYFREMTADSGVNHTYQNGQDAGNLAILESLGGGAAVIDYDGDGLLDLFIPGGGYFDGPDKHDIKGYPCKLYRNLGNWKFQDVTATVGLDQPLFFTHGAAVADYDRDGWPDILVTGWGRMALFHNESDGHGGRRFVEVTKQAGLEDNSWSSSAAWADLDGDGFPDLYVCHYVDWSFIDKAHNPECTYDGKTHDVCPPKNFTALPHKLYHNKGDGTFVEVSKSAGLRVPREEKDYEELTWLSEAGRKVLRDADKTKEYGKGLGVLAVDVNGDGKPDIYVANDTVDNFLYMNRSIPGHLRFEEIGMAAGVARDDRGAPNGSMGLDAADYDGCGRPSIWVANYESEMHALYHNECKDGREIFSYATQRSGIAALGQSYVGWGTAFMDLDHHGWQDLFIANGHAIRFPTGKAKRQQLPVLMRNLGPAAKIQFKAITEQGGPYFQTLHCARGVAFGDLDNDGRIDMVVCHLNEPAALVGNVASVGDNHWLGVELHGRGNRSVVGAKLTLQVGDRPLSRFAKGGGSYASSNDPRLVFGVGAVKQVGKLTVTWPWGKEQTWEGLTLDRYWNLTEDELGAK
jgi:hypothetical protein